MIEIITSIIAQMPNPVQLADSWADKSDRYLFIVSLIIMGLAGFWIVRYMVARLEKQAEAMAELYKEARASEARLVAVTERNTAALQGNTEVLHKVQLCFDKLNI